MKRKIDCETRAFLIDFALFAVISAVIGLPMLGCTRQTSAPAAPIYNITYTDNPQIIAGDGNTARTEARTEAKQVAEP
jgi:hypothetical protein